MSNKYRFQLVCMVFLLLGALSSMMGTVITPDITPLESRVTEITIDLLQDVDYYGGNATEIRFYVEYEIYNPNDVVVEIEYSTSCDNKAEVVYDGIYDEIEVTYTCLATAVRLQVQPGISAHNATTRVIPLANTTRGVGQLPMGIYTLWADVKFNYNATIGTSVEGDIFTVIPDRPASWTFVPSTTISPQTSGAPTGTSTFESSTSSAEDPGGNTEPVMGYTPPDPLVELVIISILTLGALLLVRRRMQT
ncbi:MAG: hypothetical protein ACXAE3_13080 [Candidatus Kariarchaeaceae archaeon]|jgi:hypothetical protein